MHVETIDGITIPNEFQDRFGNLRQHKYRIKLCILCNNKFYDRRERPRPPYDHTCHQCLVKKSLENSLDEKEASLHPFRTKNCSYCGNGFLDRSKLNTKIYCYDCGAFYSSEFLQKFRHDSNAGRKYCKFWDHEDEIIKLNKDRLTDVEIAKRLGIREHQVRIVRLNSGIKRVSNDDIRVSSGLPSLNTLDYDNFKELYVNQSKSIRDISKIYGVNRNIIKSLKKSLKVNKPEPKQWSVELTDLERQVIIGTTLGDGHIGLLSHSNKLARFKTSHQREHKEYIDFIKSKINRIVSRHNYCKNGVILYSNGIHELYELYKLFYKPELKSKYGSSGYKCPDDVIFEQLTPLSLALWYQDDGSLASDGCPNIAWAFPGYDFSRFSDIMLKKFNLRFRIKGTNEACKTIYCLDKKEFFDLVYEFICPVMAYKVPESHQKNILKDWRLVEVKTYHVATYNKLESKDKKEFEDYLINQFKLMPFPLRKCTVPIESIKTSLENSNVVNFVVSRDNSTVGLTYLDDVCRHRFESSSIYKQNAISLWSDHESLRKAIKYCANRNRPFTPWNVWKEVMNIASTPSHFRPSAASSIINHFKAKSILDPTIGWCGRTLAALCCPTVRRFHGIDLQDKSVLAAHKIAYDFNQKNKVFFSAEVGDSIQCMNRMIQNNEKFDLILTSPPFFDTEDYGVEMSENISDWYQKFVLPFSRCCASLVSKNGHIAIHLEDSLGRRVTKLFHRAMYESGLKQDRPILYNKDKRVYREQFIYIFRS